MARKPTQQQLVGGKGPRQRVWDLIRANHGCFELRDLCYGDIPLGTARTYLKSLQKAGFVEPLGETAATAAKRWRLVRNVGIDAPRVRRDGTPVTMGLAQEQMWRTLRMHKGDLNARELAAHAATTAVSVAPTAANDYLRNLHAAGYLVCTQPARSVMKNGGKAQARYRLKPGSDTGPRAPMICCTHVLYDPNTDTTVPLERVTEEVAIYGN